MLDKRVRVPAVSAPGGSSPPSGTTGRLWRFLSRVGWLFGLFGTVVLALASVDPVLNVLYTIRPDLRPEGPPVLRSVTLGEPVLEERGVPCYDGARCNRVGFDIEFQGYQRDRVEIAWAAFDPVTLRRVDLDAINFDFGSWDVGEDQYRKLERIADAMRRILDKSPDEVFLIEGHTDAVGSDIDNLSLSDRRAETVAVILTETFDIPPENLTTQGYGEQYLKVMTDGPSRINRRVSVRRITPLLSRRGWDEN